MPWELQPRACTPSRLHVGCSFPMGQPSCPTQPLEAPTCQVTPNSTFKNPLQNHIQLEPYWLPPKEVCPFSVMSQLCRHLTALTVIICLINREVPKALGQVFIYLYIHLTSSPGSNTQLMLNKPAGSKCLWKLGEKKIEAPQSVSEAIRKNKGHHPKNVLSTYTAAS